MLGWVTAALLSFLFLASPVFAQCSYQREYSAPFRTSWLDLAVDNTQLWAATGYGVALLDRTVDPPKILATKALPGTTRFVVARNGVAYAAAGSTVWTVRNTAAGLTADGSDFGRPINDLDLAGSTLIIATTDGIVAIDVSNISPSAASRFANGANIFAVAVAGGTVVAANGDRSLETFSLTGIPGPALITTVNATALHVVSDVLYASDGQTTDVFSATSSTRLGTIPFGATSLVPSSPNVLFSAGNDRRFRALDVSVLTSPVELFEAEIIPSGGSVNRVAALEAAGGRVYVAGGDTGLTTYDIASFTGPQALRGYPFGFTTSLASTDDTIVVSLGAGGLAEVRRTPSGSLTLNRTWATPQQHVVHDIGSNGLLLTSSAAVLNYWSLAPTTPSLVSTATFSGPVVSAVVRGATAYAVLEDGTLWSADMSQTAPAPQKITRIADPVTHIARSGTDLVAATLSGGQTVVLFFRDGDFNAGAPAAVSGAATAVAVSGTRVAVFTFAGITVLDFASSGVRVLPQSNAQIVTDLDLSGNTLVALTSTSAIVWDLDANRSRTFALPSEPLAVDVAEGGAVAIASSEGVIALNPSATSQQPVATSLLAGNKYYWKAVAGKDRLYLFDGRSVDLFETHFAGAPRYVATVQAPGALDLAASPNGVFVLFSNSTLTQYSRGGDVVRSLQVSQAADTTPLSVATAGGLPWVSVTQGCQTTGCVNRTFVLSLESFSQTATLPGALIDVTTADQRAFALFDSPREMRAYNVSDAFHPSLLVSRPSDAGAAAIALTGTSVLVLGERLTTNNESTLAKTGELLTPQALAANADLIADGSCLLIAGRRPEVEISSGFPAVTPAGLVAVPGTFRSIVGSDGRLYVLSDYSLDVISRVSAPRVARRRAAQ